MADFRRDTRDFLMHLEKSELVTRLMALQKYVCEERDRLNHKNEKQTKNLKRKQADIDWTSCKYRKIALKFAYLGRTFNGLQVQTCCANTVESHIWRAIVTAKLRHPSDMPGPGYSRCARTDKGVSAFQQVITCSVRSRKEDETDDESKEFLYIK